MINSRDECLAYSTKDGSMIREISKGEQQSLAEATVAPGQTTASHFHIKTEEIYYIVQGKGVVFLEDETCEVGVGDAILISPGKRHSIYNSGTQALVFLCCCAPGYQHEDTILV